MIWPSCPRCCSALHQPLREQLGPAADERRLVVDDGDLHAAVRLDHAVPADPERVDALAAASAHAAAAGRSPRQAVECASASASGVGSATRPVTPSSTISSVPPESEHVITGLQEWKASSAGSRRSPRRTGCRRRRARWRAGRASRSSVIQRARSWTRSPAGPASIARSIAPDPVAFWARRRSRAARRTGLLHRLRRQP